MFSILYLVSVYLCWFIYFSFYEDVLDKVIENQIVLSYNFKKDFFVCFYQSFLKDVVYIDFCDLFNLIFRVYIVEIILVVEYLYSYGIIYCDIKFDK